jgi:hypothetical protein
MGLMKQLGAMPGGSPGASPEPAGAGAS